MPEKNNSLFYIGASVLFVIIAIAATAIVSQSKPSGSGVDIRAKAGASSTLKATVTVAAADTARGVIMGDNFRFVQSDGQVSAKNLGSFSVTPPVGFDINTAFPGATLMLTIDPATFIIASKTVSAIQITVSR